MAARTIVGRGWFALACVVVASCVSTDMRRVDSVMPTSLWYKSPANEVIHIAAPLIAVVSTVRMTRFTAQRKNPLIRMLTPYRTLDNLICWTVEIPTLGQPFSADDKIKLEWLSDDGQAAVLHTARVLFHWPHGDLFGESWYSNRVRDLTRSRQRPEQETSDESEGSYEKAAAELDEFMKNGFREIDEFLRRTFKQETSDQIEAFLRRT